MICDVQHYTHLIATFATAARLADHRMDLVLGWRRPLPTVRSPVSAAPPCPPSIILLWMHTVHGCAALLLVMAERCTDLNHTGCAGPSRACAPCCAAAATVVGTSSAILEPAHGLRARKGTAKANAWHGIKQQCAAYTAPTIVT